MNEPRDPFEEELSTLRPVEISPDLRQRVAAGLASSTPTGFRGWRLAPLAAALAASCLLAVFFRWGGGEGPIVIPPRVVPVLAAEDSPPMLLAYQRALARSPEALVALLDKQAMANPGPGPGVVQTLSFRSSAAELHTLLGDD